MSDPILQKLEELCREAGRRDRGLFIDDLPEVFEQVAEGEFTQGYKYQSCEDVYKHAPTGRYFEISNSRTGSYHTDWYYRKPSVREVIRQVKVVETVVWAAVPKDKAPVQLAQAPAVAVACDTEGGSAD